MKKLLMAVTIVLAFFTFTFAQKAQKPTLAPKEPTPAQENLIRQGTALHDAKKYDEAIALYQKVLDENPDCVLAIYEMALSYYYKQDFVKTVETSMLGIKYDSNELASFYGLIANVWDDKGNPEKAIELYKNGIKIIEKEKNHEAQLSSLYYNLGLTYFRQKDGTKAKEALKKAVEYNYSYASPHYLLAETFSAMHYKVPALLAAARLMSTENFSQRTQRASAIFQEVLTGGAKKGKEENTINIFVDLNEPKDEGDFSSISLILGLVSAGTDTKEENKKLTEEEKFVEKVESFISFLTEDTKKTKSTFVGKNYMPFMLEMKKRGYVKPFAYLVLTNAGNKTAAKWVVEENKEKVVEFMNWAKSFQPSN